MKQQKESTDFQIDFFELSFLAEACIPPRPIARAMFWDRLIDELYHKMTDNERARLFEWMNRNDQFKLTNEGCQLFYARFNPNNQYIVTTLYNGITEKIRCFKRDDKYWISKQRSVNETYIKDVEKIEPKS